MCGIAGLVCARGADAAVVRAMTAAIAHRGPDGEGFHVRGEAGFGHRRLSIIDIEGGRQPMCTADGRYWITFNGEIYNYRELREVLASRRALRTRSDTEVVLELFAEKGPACLAELRGMFAVAIWDDLDKRLFLARDHLGQKPLYYRSDADGIAFGSEIKSVLASMRRGPELDPAALHEYLTLRIISAPRSMFRDIRKLAPGHYLTWRRGELAIERYWKPSYEPKHFRDDREALEALDQQVAEAVRYHLVADVQVGSFLSGGMDSSLVVAMMRRATSDAIPTFSGDVPYGRYSELPYSRLVAGHCGTDAHELTITPSLVRMLPELVRHLDEPSDPLSTCMYHIAALARRHVKVVLGGDGGDELFGGYDRYYGNRYASWYALLPEALRRHVIGPVIRRMPEGYWYRSMSHRLRWLHQVSFHDAGRRYGESLAYFYFSDAWRRELYTDTFQQQAAVFDPEANIAAHFDAADASELIDRMLYADSMTRMPDHPVMILDRMTMAHGLEARAPFMDHRLAEFCARLPARLKVRGRKLRYLQTLLARRYLPAELFQRDKQGFSSPLAYLLAEEFRTLYDVLLRDAHLVRDGYLRAGGVRKLLEQHLGGRLDHGQRLWQLVNAEIWYRMYIEGREQEDLLELLAAGPGASPAGARQAAPSLREGAGSA